MLSSKRHVSEAATARDLRREWLAHRAGRWGTLVAIGSWWALTASGVSAEPPVRRALALQLASPAVPQLVESLGSPDVDARVRAASALGELSTQAVEALPALVRALEDPSARVRRVTALALGKITPTTPEAVAGLIRALADPDANVPDNAAWALRTLGGVAVPGLTQALQASDVKIRRGAAHVFATALAFRRSDFATQEAISALTAALRDGDGEVRAEASRALGEIGPAARAALPLLRQLASQDPVEDVRRLAGRAAGKIQKRSPGAQ